MAKLTLTMFLSLDGVYQAPGEPDEDRSSGFDQGGWQVPYVDDDMMTLISAWFGDAGGFLMGRKTYEIFAGYWPHITDPNNPIANRMNSRPKYVASRTLHKVEWHNSTLLSGNIADQVAQLKNQLDRELQVHGCGDLAQTLMKHNLIDEYRLLVHPVVLGGGKRLFTDESVRRALRLIDSRATSTGVLVNTYQPTGMPSHGDFGLEELGERGREDFSQGIIDVAEEARRRQQ